MNYFENDNIVPLDGSIIEENGIYVVSDLIKEEIDPFIESHNEDPIEITDIKTQSKEGTNIDILKDDFPLSDEAQGFSDWELKDHSTVKTEDDLPTTSSGGMTEEGACGDIEDSVGEITNMLHTKGTIKEFFVCNYCHKSFKTKQSLRRHINIHSSEKKYICSVCSKEFSNNSNLARHMKIHTGEKINECSECKKVFKQNGNLKRHLSIHSEDDAFYCNDCHRRFTRKRCWMYHLRQHSEKNAIYVASGLIKEEIDPFAIESLNEDPIVITDIKTESKGDLPTTFSDGMTEEGACGDIEDIVGEIPSMSPTKGTINYFFVCNYCPKSFETKESLRRHKLIHTAKKKCICSVCSKKFLWNSTLVRHMKIHTGEKPFACSKCKMRFTQKDSLNNHLLLHSEDNQLYCNDCHKSFKNNRCFIYHLQLHSGIFFHCEICQKKFAKKQHLRSHMSTHSEERPFNCDICHSSFVRKHSLQKHLQIHSGERPYVCEICQKGFKRNFQLKEHLRTHS